MDYLLAAHINVTGGAAAAGEINQVITQINHFNTAARASGAGTMASQMDQAAKSGGTLGAVLGKVGDAALRMGTYMGLHLLVQALREAVTGVLDFDSAMTNSLSIQQGVTSAMRSDMEDMAKSIAVEFGMMPGDVAEGFYFLASAGLTVEQQLSALPTVAAFAKAGMMDLDAATELLFDSLSAIGQRSDDPVQMAKNLGNLSDVLTQAAIASMGTIEQFGEALANKAGSTIKAYNLDLNESVAVLEVFANQGIKGKVAGERFAMMMRDMSIKSGKFKEEWAALGIEVFDDAGNFNSLVTIFQQLDAALLPMSIEQRRDALKSLGFTYRDMNTVLAVLGTSGHLAAFAADLEHAGGVAERVAEIQMEALRAKLDQLKAVSLVFAIEGFEKLEEAAAWLVATFTPAVNAVIDVLGQLAQGAAPIAGVFAGMIAIGVVEGLQGIAWAVETVFNTIAAHEGVVEVLGAALAGLAAAQVVGAIASIAKALGETLYRQVLMAQDAVNGLIIRMMTIAQTEGVFAAVKVGLSGLISMLASPMAAGIGIAVAIYAVKGAFDDGKEAAKKFADQVEAKYGSDTLEGLNNQLTDLTSHYHELQAEQDRVTDGLGTHLWNSFKTSIDTLSGPLYDTKENLLELAGAMGYTEDQIKQIQGTINNRNTGFVEIQMAFRQTGIYAKDAKVDLFGFSAELAAAADVARKAGVEVDTFSPALERIAKNANIDLARPWHEWVPVLAVAATNSALVGDSVGHLDGALVQLADDTTPLVDKLKAFKEVMDGLSGGMQAQFDATTGFSGAMGELALSMVGVAPTFDVLTEAGRAQRDALSAGADKARVLAMAHAEVTGSMQEGAAALMGYSSGMAAIFRQAGLTEAQIHTLLETMGLTPEQISILFEVDTANATGATLAIQKEFEDTAIQAANAALALEGFKRALDILIGIPVSDMEATARASQAMNDLWDAAHKYVMESGPLATAFSEHTSAANGMQLALAGNVKTHLDMTKRIADAEGWEAGIGYIQNYRAQLWEMMAGLGMSDDQIHIVLQSLGLTDEALAKLKPGVVVPVSETGAAATGQKLDEVASPSGANRTATIEAWIAHGEEVRAGLDGLAEQRTAIMAAVVSGGSSVEDGLNDLARLRDAVYRAQTDGASADWVRRQLDALGSDRTVMFYIQARNSLSAADQAAVAATGYIGAIAEGGIVHAYAQGGFENHVAQIGRMGAARLWNEPEAGGEAYIPLALAKRQRSMAIWEETGHMLGAKPGGSPSINVSAPISFTVNAAADPAATADAVAGQVAAGVEAGLHRVLVEFRSGR